MRLQQSVKAVIVGFKKSPVWTTAFFIPVLLPFTIRYTAWAIWLLITVWVFCLVTKKIVPTHRALKYALILGSPAIIIMISLLYSSHLSAGWGIAERSLMLLFLPLVLLTSVNTISDTEKPQLVAFTAALVAGIVLCLSVAFYNLFTKDPATATTNGDIFHQIVTPWNFFSYTLVLLPMGIHPTYFSMFASLGILFLVISWRDETVSRRKVGIGLITAVIMIFTLLVSARTALIALFITLALFFLFATGQRRVVRVGIVIIATLTVIILFSVNPLLRERFQDLASSEYPSTIEGWNAVNLRMAIWSCSGDIFKDSWFAGLGAGDQFDARIDCYRQFSFYPHYGEDFNSHNQFLEYGVMGGVLLLGSFIFVLGFCFYQAVKQKNYLYAAFLIMFTINCLTESVLGVFKGIVFFSFFNSLFLSYTLKSKNSFHDL